MKKIVAAFSIVGLFLISSGLYIDSTKELFQETPVSITDIKENIPVASSPVEIEVETINKVDIKTEKRKELNLKLNEIKYIEDKQEWFNSYKDLIFEYAKWVKPPETVFDAFSEEEVRLMCQVVETETYQCDFDSKVNVANVILNRLNDGRFGDTITEIVTTPKQFVYGRKNISEDTILAVMYAYECEDTTQGALFFHSFEEAKSTFQGAKYVFSDNAIHHFYK